MTAIQAINWPLTWAFMLAVAVIIIVIVLRGDKPEDR
jgi:hypothetical protein